MRLLLCSTFALCLLQCVLGATKDPRIVGGTTETIGNAPYIVSLWKNGRFQCGGTLVSSRYVVTAAHCVSGYGPSNFEVQAGTATLNSGGVTSAVSRVMLPEAFNFGTMNKDVAVLKLSKALTGNNIKALPLCSSPMNAGAVLKVSGWGVTNEHSTTVQNHLRTVKVPVIKKTTCQRKYRFQATLSKSMVCAAKLNRKDACSGDSGGPAVHNGQLCGVVSWGIGCADRYPGVYTSVYAMRKFIRNAMKK